MVAGIPLGSVVYVRYKDHARAEIVHKVQKTEITLSQILLDKPGREERTSE